MPAQKRDQEARSARGKADALKNAGAIVPQTFGALGPAIKKTYEEFLQAVQ